MELRRIHSGEKTTSGKYVCTICKAEINVADDDEMPSCPRCDNKDFDEIR